MDVTELTCYKRGMPGPKPKPKEELYIQIPLKVPPDVAAVFDTICAAEKRTRSAMARIMLIEAMELYIAQRQPKEAVATRKHGTIPIIRTGKQRPVDKKKQA